VPIPLIAVAGRVVCEVVRLKFDVMDHEPRAAFGEPRCEHLRGEQPVVIVAEGSGRS